MIWQDWRPDAALRITALFMVIFVWVSWGYMRSREPLLRDVMLVFASVATLFVLALMRLLLSNPPEAVRGVVAALLLGQPFPERLAEQAERERLAAQAERDAAERRLQHTRRLESLGQLAGGVAHDFNNILAVIGSYTELGIETLDTPTPSPQELVGLRTDLMQISGAAERATRLTKQLLAFGRRDIAQAEVLCLNELIGDIEHMLRRAVGEHITLVTDLNPQLWHVHADPSQMEQILLNLVVNARDAMPAGGTLSIDTTNTPLEGGERTGAPNLTPGRYVRGAGQRYRDRHATGRHGARVRTVLHHQTPGVRHRPRTGNGVRDRRVRRRRRPALLRTRHRHHHHRPATRHRRHHARRAIHRHATRAHSTWCSPM